jgi:hypothetical protein
MKQIDRLLEIQKYWLILLFPLFYFFAGIYFRLILGDPSLRSIDPDYVYFMTGLNMSEGYLKVAHIDHPGTPLQILVALVFRLTYWIRGHSVGFTEDVLRNPDLYLAIVNVVINLVISIVLYIAGRVVLKKTGSITYGMLVQTIPLVSVILYEIIGRVSPEQIIPLPVIALTVFIIGHVFDKKQDFSVSDYFILGLIIGFGLSIKLTLLPLLIIPLVIVKNRGSKLLVVFLSIVFFLIIAFPATMQLERFWQWTKSLFLHSGQYGTGEKNILNFTQFMKNFAQMIRLQIHFTVLYSLLTFLVVFTLIKQRKNRETALFRKVTIASAILLVIAFQVVISGKQYAPRYFMPALMFGPLVIFLLMEIIREYHPSKLVNLLLKTSLSAFLVWILFQQTEVIHYTSLSFESQIKARKMTRDISQTFDTESIKIITTQDYGSPFAEYALNFANAWSINSLKSHYSEILGRLYPNTYQYNPWDGKFTYWSTPFDPGKCIGQKIPVYIYLEKNTEELYNRTLDKLMENGNNFVANRELIFENPVNGEAIFKLHLENPVLKTDSIIMIKPVNK